MNNIKIDIIASDNGQIFFGKSSTEILLQEFKDYMNKENCRYTAEISADCPTADKGLIFSLIKQMKDCRIIYTNNKKIKVIDNKCGGNKEKQCETQVLCAQNNSDKVEITHILQQKINNKHIENGVYITNPQSCHIDFDVVIDKGVTIYQNNFITGKTVIGKGCILMPNNCINNSVLGEDVVTFSSTFDAAVVGKNTSVGPNAYLRPDANVGEHCKIGDFVEIKNASIGNNTKVSHLTYVGDAQIGENCNIGCGVIFVNFDGKSKNKAYVGDDCFIGSNCNIIAPVKICDKVFVAAGTTVTKDLPEKAFCIGRVRQEIKEKMKNRYLER